MKAFDPEIYRHRKKDFIEFYERNGLKRTEDLAAADSVPLVVFYTFILEDYPEHKEYCEKKIKALKEFYGIWESYYKKVVNSTGKYLLGL